jgi:putative addiction module component (TIGR02574 family)
MPTFIPFPPSEFDDLWTDEKIDYLASLWDRISTRPATIEIPGWHQEVIAERLRDLDSDPNSGEPWDVVQKRLRERLDTKR